MTTPTAEDLLKRANEGDREALGFLLERHGPAVRKGLAGRIPKRWQSVLSEDDVMQQTYADVARTIAQFESHGERSFAAWLARLAECNLLDALRTLKAKKRGGDRRQIEPRAGGDDSVIALHELIGATSSTPSRHAAQKEAVGALEQALDQLPAIYRQVVVMYDLQGRSVEEVAGELKRSLGAVYMLRARAHDQLRGLVGTASKYWTHVP